MAEHPYTTHIRWTGNTGQGTAHYRSYTRNWDVAVPGKPVIPCSNDPLLGGNPGLMNPEDLLLSGLSGCHMLWYLHLAADAGVVVEFPDHVLAAADAAAAKRPGGEHRDRTGERFMTLDPASSVDLDQAFAIELAGDDVVLHYAIADVGWFVHPGDARDVEGFERGVTVYLPDVRARLYPTVPLALAAVAVVDDG